MRWFQVGDGDTPLDPDEARGLLVDVATRGELDELEQVNITDALLWAYPRTRLATELLTVSGLFELHRRMFQDVWGWAGKPRRTDKNVGIAPNRIAPQLKQLCDNATSWFDEQVFPPEEAATRFHHKLVAIHPFSNGNGRHARLVADLLLMHRGASPLSWPSASDRTTYVSALRAADRGDYNPLLSMLVPGHEV